MYALSDTHWPTSMPWIRTGQAHARHWAWLMMRACWRYYRARAWVKYSVCRSEEHTSELQSLMRISYAVFCLKKKKKTNKTTQNYKQNKTKFNTTHETMQTQQPHNI